MKKLIFRLGLVLLLVAPAANRAAAWTPLKVQTSPGGWDWPEDADTVAGLALNFNGDTANIYGLQFGWKNAPDRAAGAQFALAYNFASEAFYGLQVSPAVNIADRQYGLQLGAWNSANDAWGLQAAWLKNWAEHGSGLMLAPFNAVKTKMTGLQVGLFNNTAGDMTGLQLGLLNICRGTLKGVQLGFANIAGANALLPLTIGINAGF